MYKDPAIKQYLFHLHSDINKLIEENRIKKANIKNKPI